VKRQPAATASIKGGATMMNGTTRTGTFLFASVLLLLCGAVPQAMAAPGPKEYRQKGQDYAENRLYLDAVQQFTQAIRTNKGEISIEEIAGVFNSRGLAYEGLQEYDKAIDDYSSAISINEKNPEFFRNRGLASLHEKQYERAQDDLDKAIALQPKHAASYASRADVFLQTGNAARAVEDYGRALDLDPRASSVWYSLGMAYRQAGQEDKALQAFGKMLDAEPKHAGAAYQKAAIFSRQGKIDSACVWLDTAVENGFRDRNALKGDADFNNLRKIDCYQRVLQGN
jgi:tetratricopeptide (TPR) repeat protein